MNRIFRGVKMRSVLSFSILLALSGCAQIPTSGPVQTGVPIPEAGKVGSQISGPIGGDVPRGIVQGFLNAQRSGLEDDFSVARQYLTPRAAETWNPLARVVVTPALTTLKPQDQPDGALSMVVPAVASIDGEGRYGQAPPNTEIHLTFELERGEDEEWRIAQLDDGIVMTEPTVHAMFRSTPLYFVSLDDADLVPEERWFPVKNQASFAMSALLAGPSTWLRDAVRTKIPPSTTLELGSVRPVDAAGKLSVELSADLLSAPPVDFPYIQAQIEATLIEQVPGVKTVQISVMGAAFAPERLSPALARNREVGSTAIAIAAGHLVTINGKTIRPIEGIASLENTHVRALAVDYGKQRFFALAEDTLVELKADGSAPQQILADVGLTAPSVDRYGCVWSAAKESTGIFRVFCPSGLALVRAESTTGRGIMDMQVSRDGTRLALVLEDLGETEGAGLELAGIKRDGNGTPLSIGATVAFGSALAQVEQVRWLDDTQVVALDRQEKGDLQPFIVPTSGPTLALSKADAIVEVAAGKGARSIWLRTADGKLLVSAGELWTKVADGVSAIALPG